MTVRRGPPTSSDGGQALIEFALVLPFFLLLVFGLVEFSFMLNASSSLNYASRAAALLAAEGGRTQGTDCIVLATIERSLLPPATSTRISRVEIYWSDANGAQIGSTANVYDRVGSTACTYGATSMTVPYTLVTAAYAEVERCDVLAGCGGAHTTVDTIGVRISYAHEWATSVGRHIAGSLTLQRSTAVRMEPTL